MPRKYKRKPGVQPRQIKWTQNSLDAALIDLQKNVMGINQISRIYGIPARTLRRRQKMKNSNMLTLGKHPTLGFENEKRLVTHIQKLEAAGFPPDRQAIRMLAYQFAEQLKVKHTFNHETKMAGHQWLQSFLDRNNELSVRVAEGLSVARAQGLNREEVSCFYNLLLKVLTENDLLDKPERIYNMDETGIQLNNKSGKVLATKGSRAVKMVTSAEKGETMTVVGCCNAVGNFLPPVVIIKGVNKKPDFYEGLPQGSKVFMNKQSAYINTELFRKWLIKHFIPHKPAGKVCLILDGHTSHSSALDMLEEAEKHEVILLCLPSHTTSALQPLDRAVYKPFKSFYSKETNHFMRTNPQKKITRYNSARLIGRAWLRAATAANALSGFRGSGIFPLDPNAIPDSEFEIANLMSRDNEKETGPSTESNVRDSPSLIPELDNRNAEVMTLNANHREYRSLFGDDYLLDIDDDKTDCEEVQNDVLQNRTPTKSIDFTDNTPSKFLVEHSPIPRIPASIYRRGKQSAVVLNSQRTIAEKKQSKGKVTKGISVKRSNKVNEKENKQPKQSNEEPCEEEHMKKRKVSVEKKRRHKRMKIYSSSEEEEDNTNICCVCLENYHLTTSKADWIQCTVCKNWLHETCTIFRNYCKKCGELRVCTSASKN